MTLELTAEEAETLRRAIMLAGVVVADNMRHQKTYPHRGEKNTSGRDTKFLADLDPIHRRLLLAAE